MKTIITQLEMGDTLGWNIPLILTFYDNFQRDIQAVAKITTKIIPERV